MAGEWYKETYPYQVFRVGMFAYVARFLWGQGEHLDFERDFKDVMCYRLAAGIMAVVAMLQACINVGLVGDMWDKRKRF